MDFVGVTRTIDHAVYMLLNSLAIVLWRINTALIGISLFSYNTQDWLTGADGGVWRVMAKLVGADGIFGLATWQAFLILALTLFGLSRVVRPFLRVQPVDPGRLLLFGILAYIVITQGQALMQAVETWRAEAGSYMYAELATGETVELDIPGSPANGSTEPLAAPQDLDGQGPIRGWEAVASSYFLVQQADELHAGVPAHDFRVAYCLYDPNEPIDDQAEENSAGCSPRKAWDEWDRITVTPTITQVWGIPLPSSFSLDLPLVQEHPENRELAIRQAQAGVARLALGPIVALFPLVEANIALMLALAASFIYLSLPISLIFGFFLYTESMATRLLLQLINVIIRTLILNGLVAVFLMLLMSVSLNGSLTTYLGLVGVGLAGGFLLMRFAAGTMKETFSQALGAVGGVWLGATMATFGAGAARPARAALGLAKLGATAAVLGTARGRALDLAEAGLHSARSGLSDLKQASPATTRTVQRSAARLPAPLARLAQANLSAPSEGSAPETVRPAVPVPAHLAAASRTARPPGAAASWRETSQPPRSPAMSPVPASNEVSRPLQIDAVEGDEPRRPSPTMSSVAAPAPPPSPRAARAGDPGRLQPELAGSERPAQGRIDKRSSANFEIGSVSLPAPASTARLEAHRPAEVRTWTEQFYRAHAQGQGLAQTREAGRDLLGEALVQAAEPVLARHSQAETQAVLAATRQVAAGSTADALLRADGRLSPAGLQAVQERLDGETRQAFHGPRGEQDLATLVAMGLQTRQAAEPQAFRQATAAAQAGPGMQAPGRTVPQALGLDPVAAGAHFAGLNRFVRLSDQAGLSPAQRQQLLAEVKQGSVSAQLRQTLETIRQRQQTADQGPGWQIDELIASAQALPETLAGPRHIQLSGGRVAMVEPSAGRPTPANRPADPVEAQVSRKDVPASSRPDSSLRGERDTSTPRGVPSKIEPAAPPPQPQTGDPV